MNITHAVAVPHPPLILPEVGRGGEAPIAETTAAYIKAAEFIRDSDPETVVITTPHSVMYADWFHISPGNSASGDFSAYRAPEVKITAVYDTVLAGEICRLARKDAFPAGTEGEKDSALDHAVMIPLYFLKKAYGSKPLPKVVRIGLSGLSLNDHYRLGTIINAAVENTGIKTAFIASGDLSHYLKDSGPYGFRKEGPVYDERIMDTLGRGAFGELIDSERFSDAFCSRAGECGHRSFTIMAGVFDGSRVKSEALSHQDVTGVGYGVCLFTREAEDSERHFLMKKNDQISKSLKARSITDDPFVKLAINTVEAYTLERKIPQLTDELPPQLTEKRAGVFVSLHKNGELRGCIGTISAATENIANEIIQNGISACSRDPRFSPVQPEELPELEYSVDVLGDAEDITSPEQLDPKRYGVIVTGPGGRRGLLLPDLEGVDTIEQQISIARRKAGISPSEKISLQRFEVIRHK